MSERLGRNYQEYNYLLIIQWRNAKLRDPSVKFFYQISDKFPWKKYADCIFKQICVQAIMMKIVGVIF